MKCCAVESMLFLFHEVFGFVRSSWYAIHPGLHSFLGLGAVMLLIGRGVAGDVVDVVVVDVVNRAFLGPGFVLVNAVCCLVSVGGFRMGLFAR